MKRISWMLGAVVVVVSALTGCSSKSETSESDSESAPGPKVTVQGTVSSRLGTDNARAVAIGADGKQVWTLLDSHGDFTLRLAAGKSYRILIANQIPNGGQKVIGKVSLKNGATKTPWIMAKGSAQIDLGTLSQSETTLDRGVAPKCLCDDDKSGSSKGDDEGWSDDEPSDKKGGYGGSDKGGDGWDDESGDDDDDVADNKKDSSAKESTHDDDNDCHGDDDDVFGKRKSWDSEGEEIDLGDDDVSDVCTEGGFADLEPSKKDVGNYGDFDKKLDNLPESKGCSKNTNTNEKPKDKPADKTEPAPSKSTVNPK